MELVYLWVEDYKNIKNQGFNFSPRFECEFNEKTKEISVNKKECMKDFFGDNINVTAIIGQNGSGKSSIIKLLLLLIYFKKNKNNIHKKNEITYIKQEFTNKKIFLIINTINGLKYICIKNFGFFSYTEILTLDNEELDFFSIYFNYLIDSLQNNNDHWMLDLYHKSDNYKTPILLTPNKVNTNSLTNEIDLDMIEYINIKYTLKLYKEKIDTLSTEYFNPNKIKLYYEQNHYINDEEFSFFGKVAKKFLQLVSSYNFKYHDKINDTIKQIKNLENDRNIKNINLLYIALKILSSSENLFECKVYRALDKWFKSEQDANYLKNGIAIVLENIDGLISKDITYENEKIVDCVNFHNDLKDITIDDLFNKLFNRETINIEDIKNVSFLFVPWLDIEFLEDKKTFNTLSGGQKLFFTFIVNFIYQVKNICEIEEYNTINIFLDEVEFGYHPNWQKKFVKNILYTLSNIKLNNNKINIIFATHSPFILSDLPKENVIFLKDAKQKHIDINPFGANIHTLLSHGFFMEDGLMGEFAKEKINLAINYLNKKKPSIEEIDYCENIIPIIGEPIIKNQLQRMLDSKRLSKVDGINKKIQDMEYDLMILKQNQSKYVQDELKDKAKKKYTQSKDDDK